MQVDAAAPEEDDSEAKRPRTIMSLMVNVVGEDPGADEQQQQEEGEEEARAARRDAFRRVLPELRARCRLYEAPGVEAFVPAAVVYGTRSGDELPPHAVAQGRHKEMSTMASQGALLVLPRSALPRGAKVVRGKFLDDLRADGVVKSRFVAQEIAWDSRGDVHAGTPGLKAMRLVVALAAFRGSRLAFFDIVAAFLHAEMDELIAVAAPAGLIEDGCVFIALKALYGTRRASHLWQEWYSDLFVAAGWRRCLAFPAAFARPGSATAVCHGDDIMAEGTPEHLDALELLLTQNADTKVLGRIGPGRPGRQQMLKRSIAYDEAAREFTWQADGRHLETAAAALQLTTGAHACKGSDTPGSASTGGDEDDTPLDEEAHRLFRSVAGSVGYFALDRPDAQFALKVVLSAASRPTRRSLVRLRRLVRYLLRFPSLVYVFALQAPPAWADAFGDSDWAGSHTDGEERRRSTTAVVERIGSCVVDSCSVTQHTIALSSAEAELYALTRAAAGGLQTRHFLQECGWDIGLRVWSDSSACRGVVRRTGPAKLRHIELRWLWVQEALRQRRFVLKGLPGNVNPSDLGTKYHPGEKLRQLIDLCLGLRRCGRDGRTA